MTIWLRTGLSEISAEIKFGGRPNLASEDRQAEVNLAIQASIAKPPNLIPRQYFLLYGNNYSQRVTTVGGNIVGFTIRGTNIRDEVVGVVKLVLISTTTKNRAKKQTRPAIIDVLSMARKRTSTKHIEIVLIKIKFPKITVNKVN